MRWTLLTLALLLVAAPATAGSLHAVDPPVEPSVDGACIGGDRVRCLAMVFFCTYLVLAQGDVDRCLTVLE